MLETLPVLAALLGVAGLFGGRLFEIAARRPRSAALALSVVAFALSGVWVLVYLRGGPRIIDATAYFLSGRAMAEGHLAWPVSEPPASTMGRFLVRDTLGTGQNVAVIFPPGYPAVLALGFLAGAPMIVGPVLGAAVTWLTFELTRTAARVAGIAEPHRLGLAAAALSVVCGAMRYHTADTMSHGLLAVCAAAALSSALRLRAGEHGGFALALGLALGLALATRPVSGLALAVLAVICRGRPSPRDLGLATLGAAPSLALLHFHQLAATGAPLSSSQSLYYAVSDGPAGCFRYGFGAGVGCLHEHGDFVRANLSEGYGLLAALGTTARRLKMHGVDALNAEPLAVLVFLPALVFALRSPKLRGLALALPLFVVAYAPFYFDGNYPGGGARFFADVLPVEHALVALSLPRVAARLSVPKASSLLVGLALLGFAVRASGHHAQLRDREGGRPMFDEAQVDPSGTGLLVFVDTDHGFLLGFDPARRADRGQVEVARFRGDANDAFLWEARGKPRAVRHRYDVSSGWVLVEPYVPRTFDRIDGVSLWPPLRQSDGQAFPSGRSLAFSPGESGRVRLELALPSAALAAEIHAAVRLSTGGQARLSLVDEQGNVVASAEAGIDASAAIDLVAAPGARRLTLVVESDSNGAIVSLGLGSHTGEPGPAGENR